ncbi:MAG: hypothetical protein H0W62_02810 [Chitinophagales bacterium]|nr:hypothetical protein [Chitinophagales bacterium]
MKSSGTCKSIVFLLAILAQNFFSKAQTADEEFGQNRVQYKEFNWSFYQTDRYVVYFYLGGQELGKFTVIDGAKEMDDLETMLEYKLNDRIDILVFNNLDDLKQSNIGRGIEINNTGGVTKIIGNKMFVYFDGSHQHLQQQIRQGIASIFMQNMMFGGNIQEVVQNAVLLKIPAWYKDGLTGYIGQTWSTELDNRLRDGILSVRYKKLNRLTGMDATIAGHSVWNYIDTKYGSATIPNLLYLTRINRSMESGFNFVFGKSVKSFLQEWYEYYHELYTREDTAKSIPGAQEIIKKRDPKGIVFNQLHVNNDAKQIAYVRNEISKYRVCLKNTETGSSKKLLKGGFKSITQPIDYSQPLLSFDPTGKKLAIVYQKRDKTNLLVYNMEDHKKEKRKIIAFQKILSMAYIDPTNIVISAENKGQSDVYTFNIKSSRIEQITNDYYDDLYPHFVKMNNRQGILFSSNRIDDTLRILNQDTARPVKNLDLFFYNTETRSKELLRVTNTPLWNETGAASYNPEYFSYLSDQNGIVNRYVAHIDSHFHHYDQYYYFRDSTIVNPTYNIDSIINSDSLSIDSIRKIAVYRDTAISFAQTNYKRSILEQDLAPRAGKMAQVMLHNNRYEFSLVPIERDSGFAEIPGLEYTDYARRLLEHYYPGTTISVTPSKTENAHGDTVRADTSRLNNSNYLFQSDFTFAPSKPILDTTSGLFQQQSVFRFSKTLPYLVKFSTSYVVTQLNSSLIITRYQPFNGGGGQFQNPLLTTNSPQFQNPDLNAFIKVSISDLMEDYRITGGFMLPTSFSGTQYFLMFEDLKHRLDKQYTVYRSSNSLAYTSDRWIFPIRAKQRTYLASASFRYPLDPNRRVGLTATYRNDRINYLATDSFSLGLAQSYQSYLFLRAEYVFDNTLAVQTNIWDGTRYKIYLDASRQLDGHNTYFFAAGADFRHYEKISRNLIWATRLNGATSWGDQKVIYYLGGVDSWINAKFDQTTPVSSTAGYAFQTLAVNMRGFQQNIRNGNTFALINTEIRFPVFSYLFNTPIRSELIRNFQLVGFGDAGTAWQGLSPYSHDNPFNSSTITQGPVTVHVNYFREPVVVGYGIGARTTILGYFLRVDYAQGIDSGAKKKPIWYFSLSTDF